MRWRCLASTEHHPEPRRAERHGPQQVGGATGEFRYWHLADIDAGAEQCPLLEMKRTSLICLLMSVYDPKRTFRQWPPRSHCRSRARYSAAPFKPTTLFQARVGDGEVPIDLS